MLPGSQYGGTSGGKGKRWPLVEFLQVGPGIFTTLSKLMNIQPKIIAKIDRIDTIEFTEFFY